MRESNYKSFISLLEDTWEEFQIQLYGIIGAVVFFILLYIFVHPIWMSPLAEFLHNFSYNLYQSLKEIIIFNF